MTFYKVLGEGLSSYHGGSGKWTVGKWRSVKGPIVPCEHGLHFCNADQLLSWLGPIIAPFEPAEGAVIVEADEKLVCRKGRIGEPFATWNARTQRLFAADCAEHVLPHFEERYPDDQRPRESIAVARRFAIGDATEAELRAASIAAYSASIAAYSAAAKAASIAAYSAAYCAADSAAYCAASIAAYSAADSAASSATSSAERRWQTQRLLHYLGIAVEVAP